MTTDRILNGVNVDQFQRNDRAGQAAAGTGKIHISRIQQLDGRHPQQSNG
ncbi:hypothetical protein GSbR_25140 [Geobacter sp. SVR]|nr:hypothetical protein GSVR_25360 [Geobacter sp. SVR]GCF85914.1 hypothetical protein GSbR_25140 [Geobacter sp. SVR]